MSDLIPPPFISNSPPSINNPAHLDQTDCDLNDASLDISLRRADVVADESSSNWDPFNTSQPGQTIDETVPSHDNGNDWASFNQNEVVQDEEDEFTDFVDNAQEIPQVESSTLTSVQPISVDAPPATTKIAHTEPVCPPFNFVEAVEHVFGNVNSLNIQSSESTTLFQDQVSQNETWQELKKYTSINDASISLQFKWYLSNLEELYIDALSLERIAQNSKKKKAILSPNYVSSTILQPVKLEPNVNSENKKVQIAEEQKPHVVQVDSVTTSLDATSNTGGPINIDLSYFESQINSENKQEASKSKPDGKKYLDQLLKDIYVKDNDDNKSSNPGLIDGSDSITKEEAQELASRLPDLSFMKSKTLVVPTLKSTTNTAGCAATTTITK